MRWLSGVARHWLRIGIFFVFTFALTNASSTFAVDTTIGAAVCGSGAGASLSVDAPPSDSVVDQPTVKIIGTVADATQIDISIDGQYDSTVPLSVGQTSYQADVQLTAGTHTISLVANDACQMQDAEASIVVTYQPKTTPGSGSETPTDVGDGVEIGGKPVNDENTSKPIGAESWPVIGPIIQLGGELARNLDFEVGTPSGTLWRSGLRFSFIVVGLSVALLGNAAISAWGLFGGSVTPRLRWGTRVVGIILIILAFLI